MGCGWGRGKGKGGRGGHTWFVGVQCVANVRLVSYGSDGRQGALGWLVQHADSERSKQGWNSMVRSRPPRWRGSVDDSAAIFWQANGCDDELGDGSRTGQPDRLSQAAAAVMTVVFGCCGLHEEVAEAEGKGVWL